MKQFKIVPVLYQRGVWYSLYEKRKFFGWRYLDIFPYEYKAKQIAEELCKPIIYYNPTP